MRREYDAEDGAATTRSAVCGCAVEISIVAYHERRERIRAIRALERNEGSKGSVRCNSEDSPLAGACGKAVRGPAEKGSSVESAVVRLDQPGGGLLAVGKVKTEQGRQRTVGGDLEYRPLVRSAAERSATIKIAILALDKPALGPRAIRTAKGEQGRQGAAGRDSEDVPEADAAVDGSSVEITVVADDQTIALGK